MQRGVFRHFSFCSSFSFLVLVLVLTSCSSGAPATVGASITATASVAGAPALETAYNYERFQKLSGLFLKLDGFICTDGPFLSNLTIARRQDSYDVGSAQIIQNYVQLLAANANVSPAKPYPFFVTWTPPRPPQELQWMPGSTTCAGDLAITNTGQSTIEVQSFGMQLTEPPGVNAYHYQRISVPSQCPGCGGHPACAYTITLALNGGGTGSAFEGPLTSTDSVACPLPLIIPAQGSAELLITFRDAHMRDLIYTGTPVLHLEGMPPIALTALTSRLTFTHTDTFPCYQFQGNAFVSAACPARRNQ